MVRKRSHETRTIVWPHYFDRRVSRAEGRRVPKKISMDSPKLERIASAADAAGLRYEIDADAAHPFFWWEKSGRLLVVSDKPKTKVLKLIASHIQEKKKETS
ncbi:MAG: signal recognition particle protein Srp19 [Thermoplasmata archaeon]|nr:signal recognition particle protein Srp19 [Thermoplasmata archaeon]